MIEKKPNYFKTHWREIVSRGSLPLLTLGAMYGVYSFSALFVPELVAVIIAGAFELVYVGLAIASDLNTQQRARAKFISLGAVAVSVSYNWVAGILHVTPELFAKLDNFAKWILAGLHGAPLAVLAYLVADLLLHTGVETEAVSYGLFSRKAKKLAAEAWSKVRALEENLQTATAKIANLENENARDLQSFNELQDFNIQLQKDYKELQAVEQQKQFDAMELAKVANERDFFKNQNTELQEIIRNGKAHNEKLVAESNRLRGELQNRPATVAMPPEKLQSFAKDLKQIGGELQARSIGIKDFRNKVDALVVSYLGV